MILGIETSCDETAAAVYDPRKNVLLSHVVFSQIELQSHFGGVVPEIASRVQLEKIDITIAEAIQKAGFGLDDISLVAVTTKPGLVGSLLIGISFAKSIAWAKKIPLLGIDHLEGHVFSSFIKSNGSFNDSITFPHIALSVSGGHTALYYVEGFGKYEQFGQTIDDAAGEAFDKISFLLGCGYPGGPIIEKLARENGFKDVFKYPRGKDKRNEHNFNVSFSGLKTAVLYDLIKKNVFSLEKGIIPENVTLELQRNVASSLLVCISEIFEHKVRAAFKKYPYAQGLSFVGGVAANNYICERLKGICERRDKFFVSPPKPYCTDNAAMIAFVASYKSKSNVFSPLSLDVYE